MKLPTARRRRLARMASPLLFAVVIGSAVWAAYPFLHDMRSTPELVFAASTFVYLVIQMLLAVFPQRHIAHEYHYEEFKHPKTLKTHIDSGEPGMLAKDGWELMQADHNGALYRR